MVHTPATDIIVAAAAAAARHAAIVVIANVSVTVPTGNELTVIVIADGESRAARAREAAPTAMAMEPPQTDTELMTVNAHRPAARRAATVAAVVGVGVRGGVVATVAMVVAAAVAALGRVLPTGTIGPVTLGATEMTGTAVVRRVTVPEIVAVTVTDVTGRGSLVVVAAEAARHRRLPSESVTGGLCLCSSWQPV